VRLTAVVRGRVQGVGFRWWTRCVAREFGLVGTATNRADGAVEVVAEGPEPACRALLDALRGPAAPGRVRDVAERFGPAQGNLSGFREQ
jgi:acylphosphatase